MIPVAIAAVLCGSMLDQLKSSLSMKRQARIEQLKRSRIGLFPNERISLSESVSKRESGAMKRRREERKQEEIK
jgi:hypothetical protein